MRQRDAHLVKFGGVGELVLLADAEAVEVVLLFNRSGCRFQKEFERAD